MSFVENYKKGLAIVAGTICLLVALYLPGKYAVSEKMHCEIDSVWKIWTGINWIFLGLAIIFLWGEIRALAESAQGFINKRAK